MYNFINDYSEGAHESIIEELVKTNRIQTVGYGEDKICKRAAELIKNELKSDSDIHFMVGGTQTNLTVISHILKPYEGVISASSGHINVHETGAIEATGHKVLVVPSKDGKLTAQQIIDTMEEHLNSPTMIHMSRPGMVYISNPTELGTIYKKQELNEIHSACKKYNIPLYMDGARLGCALASPQNDINFHDLAELTDIFYIGGTKMGALFGEALVINNPIYNKNFLYMQKQKGGLLAKGRLLGIQFEKLFTDGLYIKLAGHAVKTAQSIQNVLIKNNYALSIVSPTNQIFPIIEDKVLEKLSQNFNFEFIGKTDSSHSCIRICTSWATDENEVQKLIKELEILATK